jgi:hypothetical protein
MNSKSGVIFTHFKELYKEEQNKNIKINTFILKYNFKSIDDLLDFVEKHVRKNCNVSTQDTPENIQQDIQNNSKKDNKLMTKLDTDNNKRNNNENYDKLTKQIEDLTSQIDNLTKINIDNNKKMEEMQDIHKKELEDLKLEYSKKNVKLDPLPTPSNSNENKTSQNENSLGYSKYAKISVYDNVKNEWQEHIATDTIREIDNTIDLKNKINKEKTKLIDVQKWCTTNPKNCSKTKRYYIKRKIEIADEIWKYKDKMKYIDFDLDSVARLNKNHYELWKKDLLIVIDSIKIKSKEFENCSQNLNIQKNLNDNFTKLEINTKNKSS